MIDKESYDVIYAEDYLDQYSDRLSKFSIEKFISIFLFESSEV